MVTFSITISLCVMVLSCSCHAMSVGDNINYAEMKPPIEKTASSSNYRAQDEQVGRVMFYYQLRENFLDSVF